MKFQRGSLNAGGMWKNCNFWPMSQQFLRYSQKLYKIGLSYCRTQIGTHMWYIEWCHFQWHFQWPWITPNLDFKDTSLFDVEYVRNSTRYGHSYNGVLVGAYAVYFAWALVRVCTGIGNMSSHKYGWWYNGPVAKYWLSFVRLSLAFTNID